ncbi:MAG: hypothetical protein COB85_02615 [Bacteroidetes bacterium]|nr:MAG: hypothetical protein COB85_02615 [Bacteroidota bacterium]
MKKLILSLVFAGSIVFSASAQGDKKVEILPVQAKSTSASATGAQPTAVVVPPANPNAPEIKFESDVIDYGTIDYNGDGMREFVFTNTGKEPLIITRAKGSCGCTVPTWPKEPIMPGQQGKIKVKYATNRPGKFTKSVTISSNATTASKRLTIKGTVKPKPVVATDETMPVKKATEGATPLEKNQ